MAAPLLVTRNLTRMVGNQPLVEEVSFEVQQRDVFVIFGASGAGKSTLLRLINRLDEPTSGTVLVGGTDYRTIPPRELRRRIGFVPQRPTLMPGTVAENVAWGDHLRSVPADEQKVERLLRRLGLDGYEGREAQQLSGGEAQRVAIARTLYNGPEIVLLDEPASSLDAGAARRVEALLEEVIGDLALTVLLVTHDAARARRFGTRGVRLAGGRLQQAGAIDSILADQ